jgi:GT2 family glycosyltransferase
MTIDIPVVIIFYNRPEKLKRLFIELKKFKPKKLFLISDGSKNTNDKEKILKCRKLIKPNWKCKIYKNF